MASWKATSRVSGAEYTSSDGSFDFLPNLSFNTDNIYDIVYIDDNNCSATTTYTVPHLPATPDPNSNNFDIRPKTSNPYLSNFHIVSVTTSAPSSYYGTGGLDIYVYEGVGDGTRISIQTEVSQSDGSDIEMLVTEYDEGLVIGRYEGPEYNIDGCGSGSFSVTFQNGDTVYFDFINDPDCQRT